MGVDARITVDIGRELANDDLAGIEADVRDALGIEDTARGRQYFVDSGPLFRFEDAEGVDAEDRQAITACTWARWYALDYQRGCGKWLHALCTLMTKYGAVYYWPDAEWWSRDKAWLARWRFSPETHAHMLRSEF